MLSRQLRLPASVVINNPPVFSDNTLVIKAKKNTLSHSRYGFVIAKSVDKRATERNRLKRMVRSFVEEKWMEAKGYDVLFILRPQSKAATREDMQTKVDMVMSKITDVKKTL